MNKKKIITIITTLYNKAKYLETWAESLSKQTYLDKMIILVIDDCSTDDSLSLVKKLIQKYHLPVKLLCNEKNRGLLYTIRRAYRELQSKDLGTQYFAVLDADDCYLSPQKVEKAVNFLESHKDFSAYACNFLLEYAHSENKIALPKNIPNQSFSTSRELPFFQTSAVTFRNFFTPALLDRIDYFTDIKKYIVCEGDTFRNSMALGYGKFYFDNSTDAVWRCDIGDWGTLSSLEQDLCNLVCLWELFDFYKEHFKTDFRTDDNTKHYLTVAATIYRNAVINFSMLLQNLDFFKFCGHPYFNKTLGKYGSNDTEQIVNALLHHGKLLKDLGVSFKNA